MNEIKIFENPAFGSVRTIEKDGEPWFVGKDVAEILGYAEPRSAVSKKVDAEDRGVAEMETPSGIQQMTIINESGLYSLILKSNLPTAKDFKRWVTSEVLPSIRKSGGYIAGQEQMTDLELVSRAFMVVQRQLEQREGQVKTLLAENAKLTPKAFFSDVVATSAGCITIGQLAKLIRGGAGYNIGQNRLFAWMREHGYLIRRGGKNRHMPTQEAMDRGLFRLVSETGIDENGMMRTNYTVMVTGKGQVHFVTKFMPAVEQMTIDNI